MTKEKRHNWQEMTDNCINAGCNANRNSASGSEPCPCPWSFTRPVEQAPSKEQMISLDEVIKLYDRIQHVYDDALVPVEAGVVKRLCAELCDQRMLSTAHEPKSDQCEVCAKPLPPVGAWSMPSCPECQELLEGLGELMADLADREQTIKADWIGRAINLICARPSQPPATAQMTLARANEIAEDIAEAMRITSKGEWVIDLVGGPFTADQLEAIAVIMRNEASETKGAGRE